MPGAKPEPHVLIIDDEPDVTAVVRDLLHLTGYAVTVCTRADEALALFRQRHGDFDAVLLDMVMPEMGGADLFEAMRAIDPGLRVLVVTAFAEKPHLRKILQAGAKGYLSKPYDMDDLLYALRTILEGRRIYQTPPPENFSSHATCAEAPELYACGNGILRNRMHRRPASS